VLCTEGFRRNAHFSILKGKGSGTRVNESAKFKEKSNLPVV
jgi:hypothetical protein